MSVLSGGYNSPNPVTELVLLEELFGEVLKVSLGECDVGCHGNLSVTYWESMSVLLQVRRKGYPPSR